jgi:peptidoglycan/xylan/chitin deacetylase (PgdA/CDA1 family)
MIDECPLYGADLPPKTLCLTFDDGPGESTAELGQFLHQEGIQGTFFVIGQYAEGRRDILEQLVQERHIVANHTYTHPGLADLMNRGGDPVDELVRTDRIIDSFCWNGVKLFRPPYGNWRPAGASISRSNPALAARLNSHPKLAAYIGPIHWDVSAEDFTFWQRGARPEKCYDAYLRTIERFKRGIVLMHDGSDNAAARRNNRTLELVRLLAPELKSRGYAFVPITDLPQIKSRINI